MDRPTTDQELRASEARFRAFFDHAVDAIFLLDEPLNVVEVNRQACENLGYGREELIGKHPREFDAALDDAAIAGLSARVGAGETITFESVHRRKDGSEFPVEIRVGLLQDGGGHYRLCIARDITERKRAEQRISRQEVELRQVLELTPLLVAVFGDDRKRLYANRATLDYFGVTLDQWQAVSDPLWFFHPEDRDRIARDVYGKPPGDRPQEFEARVRKKDGTYRWFLIRDNALRDEDGRITRWLLSGTDIEDRKRTEDALGRSEACLAEAQRLTKTGSWTLDPSGRRPRYWSAEMFRIWGFDPAKGIPDPETTFARVHPDDFEQSARHFERALALAQKGGASEDAAVDVVDVRLLMPDGTVKHLRSAARAILDDGGQLVEYVGANVDITEQKHAEAERERLRQLESELAHINRVSMVGEMVASIAHEISQPLAALISNAGACRRWLAGNAPRLDRARETADWIVHEAERAGEIVNRVRALVKKVGTPRSRLDLNDSVREVLALVADEAKSREVVIQTDFAPDLAPVLGDRVQVQQVVLNLVVNAIDAMREAAVRRLVVSTRNEDDGQVRVAVRDTGKGLDPTTLDRMFDAFYSTKPGGMGMGLSISRSIVQSHAGRMWAAPNDDGPGAAVQFTVPRYEE